MAAMRDSRQVPFETGQRISYWLQERTVGRLLAKMLEKVGDGYLAACLDSAREPAQKFFDMVGFEGSEAPLNVFEESVLLMFRPPVTEAVFNSFSTAARNAGDMRRQP